MRKYIKRNLVAGILTLSLATSIMQETGANAASLKINKKKLTLTIGKSYKLKIKGSKKKVAWKSSSKKVATVTKKGKVTAKKAGKATITAKVNSKKFRCKVTVKTKQTVKPSKPVVTSAPPKPQKPTTTAKPSSGSAATPSTSAVTEKSAYAKLNSLRSTYPEGMRLTNSYYYYSPRFGNGYGCYGFAAKLSDTIFGTEKAYTTHKAFDKIKVGDNIRIGNYHSVIVLTKENNYITVVEGNFNSSVHWDRKITSASLASEGFTVYTRY